MRDRDPKRLKGIYCPGCGKTSTFILVDGRYVFVGDERIKRMGCGKILEKE